MRIGKLKASFVRQPSVAGLSLFGVIAACGGDAQKPEPIVGGTNPTPSSSASSASVSVQTAPKVTTLATDARITLPSGASFPGSATWLVTDNGKFVMLEPPEKGVAIRYVEVPSAAKAGAAKEAIATAWKLIDPAFAGVENDVFAPPADRTWDEVYQIDYRMADGTVAVAKARRKGPLTWVAILSGTQQALSRRGAQVQNAFTGLERKGDPKDNWETRKMAELTPKKLEDFSAFANKALRDLKIPGASVAIVQDGKAVFERGFGKLGLTGNAGKADVTPKTRFLIGSTTKSLSTLLMAKVVDEGKFKWESKVTEVDPTFALGDAKLGARLEMQHLVCACTGIPSYDLEMLFTFEGKKPEALMQDVKSFLPTTGFGETFQYNNQLVAVGGYLAARVYYPKLGAAEAYNKALREKVLTPLGPQSHRHCRYARRNDLWRHREDAIFIRELPAPTATKRRSRIDSARHGEVPRCGAARRGRGRR
jgi:CubicO group peptidase (beta-lactamase class C family)